MYTSGSSITACMLCFCSESVPHHRQQTQCVQWNDRAAELVFWCADFVYSFL